MSPKNKDNEQEFLSFEELKEKLQDDPKEDTQMEDLLEDLHKMSSSVPEPKKAEPSVSKEKEETPQNTEAEYKSIFDDVLKSVMQPTEEKEQTSRKQKYNMDSNQFVDVTDEYASYGSKRENPKGEKLEEYKISSDKTEDKDKKPTVPIVEYKSFKDMFLEFLKKVFPNKEDVTSEKIRKIVMDVACVVLVGCFIYFGVYGVSSIRAKKMQATLNGYVMPDDIGDSSLEGDEWAQFLSKYPNVQFPEGMMKKYAYLYAINPDLVGWVRVPGTMINIQVVQSSTAEAEYLRKDFYGNKSRYGTPYMDYRDDPKYLSQNTTIYGHHMSDGLVFADLKKYKTIEGFKENPIFYFDTLYKKYTFKVYAVIISNSQEKDDGDYIFNYTVPNFKSQDQFMSYVAALDERSLYKTGVDIQPNDKLLTLSTCTYEFSDARLAIVGRMVRDGESEDVDVSAATVNPNPRYPQAWYDKKGIDNPYADAEKWYY